MFTRILRADIAYVLHTFQKTEECRTFPLKRSGKPPRIKNTIKSVSTITEVTFLIVNENHILRHGMMWCSLLEDVLGLSNMQVVKSYFHRR